VIYMLPCGMCITALDTLDLRQHERGLDRTEAFDQTHKSYLCAWCGQARRTVATLSKCVHP
jgi:hypothetical protein